MRTQFHSREAARAAYLTYRKRWSRDAAWALMLLRHAKAPEARLAAALALARYGIPREG